MMADKMDTLEDEVRIAMVGKYTWTFRLIPLSD